MNHMLRATIAAAFSATSFLAATSALASNLYANTTQGIINAFATANANPTVGYTLFIAPNTYTLTTPLTYNQTTGTLHVRGCNKPNPGPTCVQDLSNPNSYQISGNSTSALLTVNGGNLSLWGLTLTEGGYNSVTNPFAKSPIQINGGWTELNVAQVTNNHANQFGGAIGIWGGTLVIYNTSFMSNQNDQWQPPGAYLGGTGYGGALAAFGGTVTAWEDSFYNNKAPDGGAIFVTGSANVTLGNTTLASNLAMGAGGAILVGLGNPSLYLVFDTITNNTAGYAQQGGSINNYGGGLGIYNFTGLLETAGNVIAQNYVNYNQNWSSAQLAWLGTDCYANAYNWAFGAWPNAVGDITSCYALRDDNRKGFYGTAANPFNPQLGAGRFYQTTYGSTLNLYAFRPNAGSPILASYQSDSSSCVGAPFDCPPAEDELFQSRNNASLGKADYGAFEATGH